MNTLRLNGRQLSLSGWLHVDAPSNMRLETDLRTRSRSSLASSTQPDTLGSQKRQACTRMAVRNSSIFPIGAAHSEASLNRRGESTTELIRRLRVARKRGYVTAAELEAVCYWKSPRAIQYIRSNSPARVRATTRSALATRSERRRLEAPRQLKGVSVPMASALLML